jgi:hypothetical protein
MEKPVGNFAIGNPSIWILAAFGKSFKAALAALKVFNPILIELKNISGLQANRHI